MTNTDQLRELIADVIRNKSHYGVAETPVLNGLMPLIEQHTATAVRAARIDELNRMPNHTEINLYVRDRMSALTTPHERNDDK